MERRRLLHEMGLGPVWVRRQPALSGLAGATAGAPFSGRLEHQVGEAVPHSDGASSDPLASGDHGAAWKALSLEVADCRACGLCEGRKQSVLGVGDTDADWLFVGEGPGAEEDQRGEPFVGQAGKLLDNMLAAIGLRRGNDVYIANAVKCRPPANRTPEVAEIDACRHFLERQIALLRPRLIVALGRPAAQTLLGTEVRIASARGQLHQCHGIPLVVTYHPAYLLRNLHDKAKAWEDLCFMRATMRGLKGAARN